MMELPDPLAPLGQFRQFIGFRLQPDPKRAGKMLKKPVDIRTGQTHNPHDPAIWQDFRTVSDAVAAGTAHGVGFVFTPDCGLWFLDIDDALQCGKWSPLSQQLLNLTAGAAIEVSQSGTGLHVIGSGRVPPHSCKNTALNLELYTADRFVALTGKQCSGNAAHDCSAAMAQIVADYFPPDASGPSDGWTDEPCPGWDGHTDDGELLRHACKSGSAASAFGNRASFADLFEGREDALATAYPDDSGTRAYDASSADAALAQHLAFWTGKDCERIQRLMLLSGLKRDKWDRADYLPRTIVAACNRCTDVHQRKTPATTETIPGGDLDTLPADGKGNTVREVAVLLRANGLPVAYDEFQQRIMLVSAPQWPSEQEYPRAWTDRDTIECLAFLQQHGYKPTREAVFDAVTLYAGRNSQHPVRTYLNGLKWDGLPRLDSWLSDYLGAAPSEYHAVIGAKFLIAAVARIMQPGCKVDTVLVFEGAQGIGKSTTASILAGDWFTDELPDVGSKDAALQLHGAWIVEIAELDAINRSELSTVKKFISRHTDRYRPPYGRITQDVPRQCVFIGTSNESQYLKDSTGNRRFWPVKCNRVDVAAIRRDRDQLWAEALQRFRQGENWWLTADQERVLAEPAQQQRKESDPWLHTISRWITDRQIAETTTAKVASEALFLSSEKLNSGNSRRIANCLRELGWSDEGTKKRFEGSLHPVRVFVPVAATSDEPVAAHSGTGIGTRTAADIFVP
ncbi:VapE domain-containing protein [Marinobacter sp. DUT-1]|uniref:phage NrS-1 polymerase family protein n=1 Tax=Marinobacter sp. DUT-1 TaxID=3412037 RepID=UPI003D178B5B